MNKIANRIKSVRVTFSILFLVYLLLLFKVVLFKIASTLTVIEYISNNFNWDHLKRKAHLSSNFVPFKSISYYAFYETNQNIIVQNIIGNMIIFLPFGFLLPLIVARKFNVFSLVKISFFLSLVLELIQLFSGIGSCDVDDLILNTFGALLGFCILNILTMIIKSRNKTISN